MAIKGGAAITSDRSGYKTHKKILEEGESQIPSERFIDYAKAYSRIAPNDIMDTPEKVAAAGIVLNNSGVIDRKTETDIKREPPQRGFGFGYGYPFGMGVEGNALDEITNIVGTKKGVVVKDGVANLNGVPYTGKLVMLGNEIPQSVRSPLKSINYTFGDTEQVDVNMVDGKIESIQALGRTVGSKQPARRKSLVSRSTMENAQLKFSTEPQRGPQMQFGQGLAPKGPTFTFPGGKPIKF